MSEVQRLKPHPGPHRLTTTTRTVTHERITDNIRNAIDFYFVFSLTRREALLRVLNEGLGIGSDDACSRCADYLKESSDIARRRESLMNKLERLKEAQKVFAEAGL